MRRIRRCPGENVDRRTPLPPLPNRLRTVGLIQQRGAIHQDDVTTDTKPRAGLRQSNRVLKSLAVGHQCGRSDDPVFMSLCDGAIHPGSKSEIVGIDDQAAHGPV